MSGDLQFDSHGRLHHFLTTEGLDRDTILQILDTAESFVSVGEREIKKVPLLHGKTVVNLFFESSTRTRTTFEIAAKRLSADVINVDTRVSSTTKGETLLDTIRNLEAMHTDLFVVRHSRSGAAYLVAQHVPSHVRIINAGDGSHAHPTQGMLDMFTIRRYKGSFEKLKVAIVGDILHSRVARSNIYAFGKMGAEVRIAAPPPMIPAAVETLGVKVFTSLREAIEGVDVVMALRIQNERLEGSYLPSVREYSSTFGIDREKLKYAKEDVIVMHPGPVNRGVELASEVVDHERAIILDQVTNGVAVRMAVLYLLAGLPRPNTELQ